MKTSIIILTTLFLSTAGFTSQAITLPGPLVDADWLKSNLNDTTVLSLRADVKNFTKQPLYKTSKKTKKKKLFRVGGHIPGARLVNYKKIRGNQIINGKKIKKMLPDKKAFEKLIRAAGVNKNDTIIISTKGHSDGDITMATRLYWQLKYFGHKNMAILDGGLAAWTLAGNPLEFSAAKKQNGNWQTGKIQSHILASSGDVEMAIKNKTPLIDNRSLGQYLGTWHKSYVYDGGHIPGAKVFPTELMTQKSLPARFLKIETLRKTYKTMGINPEQPSISYCNSGILATGSWFILSELLGNKKAKMYDGSMHQWTLEKRPVKSLIME